MGILVLFNKYNNTIIYIFIAMFLIGGSASSSVRRPVPRPERVRLRCARAPSPAEAGR